MGLGSGIRDPGSEIRDPKSGIQKITYSGSRIRVQGSKRPRIPDPVSRFCRIRNTAKIAVYLSLGLYAGEAFSSQKKASSTSIHEIS
jgi:hypothetical protein